MDRYFSVTLMDDYGRTTARKYEVESQVDIATYESLAGVLAGHLASVTDLALIRMQLTLPIDEDFPVTQNANVDVGATFSGFIEGGAGKKASLKLPGIKPGLVEDDGSVNPFLGDVAAWLQHFEDAAGELLLSDGEQISDWIAGSLDK